MRVPSYEKYIVAPDGYETGQKVKLGELGYFPANKTSFVVITYPIRFAIEVRRNYFLVGKWTFTIGTQVDISEGMSISVEEKFIKKKGE
jgi:hypothetical protein